MIIGLQIVGILFSLLMIYFAVLHYRRGEIGTHEIVVWIVVWVFTILATMFPDMLRTYAETFAVSRLFDLMVVGALILSLYMISAVYVRTRKIEKKVEEFVRKETINNVRSKNNKKR